MQGEDVSKPVLQVIVSTVPSLLCQPLGDCMGAPECSQTSTAEQGCSTFSSLNFVLHWLGYAVGVSAQKRRIDESLPVDVTFCF